MLPINDLKIALEWWIILSKLDKYKIVAIPEISRLQIKINDYGRK